MKYKLCKLLYKMKLGKIAYYLISPSITYKVMNEGLSESISKSILKTVEASK